MQLIHSISVIEVLELIQIGELVVPPLDVGFQIGVSLENGHFGSPDVLLVVELLLFFVLSSFLSLEELVGVCDGRLDGVGFGLRLLLQVGSEGAVEVLLLAQLVLFLFLFDFFEDLPLPVALVEVHSLMFGQLERVFEQSRLEGAFHQLLFLGCDVLALQDLNGFLLYLGEVVESLVSL